MSRLSRRILRSIPLEIADIHLVHRSRRWEFDELLLKSRNALDDAAFVQNFESVSADGKSLMDFMRLYVIWSCIRDSFSTGGHSAEVGAYKGGTSKFIDSAMTYFAGGHRGIHHVLDTFEGHPDRIQPEYDSIHKEGMLSETSYDEVSAYLDDRDGVNVIQGIFPDSATSIEDLSFSFVHLDTDIYSGTLDGLSYFVPRMLRGGTIVVDDFGARKCPGVESAVRKFLKSNRRDLRVGKPPTEQFIIKKIL